VPQVTCDKISSATVRNREKHNRKITYFHRFSGCARILSLVAASDVAWPEIRSQPPSARNTLLGAVEQVNRPSAVGVELKSDPRQLQEGVALPAERCPCSLLSPSCSSLLLRLQFTPSIYISHPSHTGCCVLYLPFCNCALRRLPQRTQFSKIAASYTLSGQVLETPTPLIKGVDGVGIAPGLQAERVYVMESR